MSYLKKILVSDHRKCTGCRSCETWCSFHHSRKVNISQARLKVVSFPGEGRFVPQICHQCKDPWCLNACPVDAMARDAKTKAVVILYEKCTGCLACADACPFGMVKVNSEGNVFKCDLCQGEPECVKSCTRRALIYVEPENAYTDRAVASAGKIRGEV